MAINSTTKRRRIQITQTRILGSSEDAIWMPITMFMRSCRAKYDLKHSLSCKKGDFIAFRHYLLRNITSKLIDQVFHNVPVQPPLQTLIGEMFDGYINECERRS